MSRTNLDIYLQARMGSTRLPGKTLMEIIDGKSMLDLCIERLQAIEGFDRLILITTTNPKDNVLEEYAKKRNLNVFWGRGQYVLPFFYEAAQKFNSQNILRATADNPLVDPQEATKLIKAHFKTKADYTTNRSEEPSGLPVGLPIGVGVEIFTKEGIENIYKNAHTNDHKEHMNDYVFDHKDQFKITIVPPLKANFAPNLRLTVDTPEDMEKMRFIYKKLYKPEKLIRTEDVIRNFSS